MSDSIPYVRFFCGGLTRTLTSSQMREHFQKFGTVVECEVFSKGGQSMGYGFVRFDQPHPEVLQHEHIINESHIDVQLPKSSKNNRNNNNNNNNNNRVAHNNTMNSKRSRSPSYSSSSSRSSSASRSLPRGRRGDASSGHPSNYQPPLAPPSRPPQQVVFPSHPSSSMHHHHQTMVPPVTPQVYHSVASPIGAIPSVHHHHHGYPPQPPSAPSSGIVVCIPYELCPPAFVADKRVFLAKHEPHTGGLSKISSGL